MPNSFVQDIVAIFDHPVAGNPTQYMTEKAGEHAGIDWRFLTFDIPPESLGDAMRGLRVLGFAGASIGPLHRHAVLEHLDEVDETARLLGRVDCIARANSRLVGTNHEAAGVIRALRERCDIQGKRAVVFGAGPLAKILADELVRYGAVSVKLAVHGAPPPDDSSADAPDTEPPGPVTVLHWQDQVVIPPETDIVILTQNGEAGLPSVDLAQLPASVIIVNATNSSSDNPFLRTARERGCITLGQWELFVHQSASAFELWTGSEPNISVLREAMEEFLEL